MTKHISEEEITNIKTVLIKEYYNDISEFIDGLRKEIDNKLVNIKDEKEKDSIIVDTIISFLMLEFTKIISVYPLRTAELILYRCCDRVKKSLNNIDFEEKKKERIDKETIGS